MAIAETRSKTLITASCCEEATMETLRGAAARLHEELTRCIESPTAYFKARPFLEKRPDGIPIAEAYRLPSIEEPVKLFLQGTGDICFKQDKNPITPLQGVKYQQAALALFGSGKFDNFMRPSDVKMVDEISERFFSS